MPEGDTEFAAMTPWVVPGQWRQIDFISDLHLSPDLPQTLAAFQRYLHQTPADALFILGDFFEAWVGDDARFEGFEAELAGALRVFSKRRTLAFMVGNRDFLLGPAMAAACGMVLLTDPTVVSAWGQKTLLTHGDAWCLGDQNYQQFRNQVRDPSWQAAFLAQPLETRREQARRMREESRRRQTQNRQEWHDLDHAVVLNQLRQTGCNTLIHGHTHRPDSEPLAPGVVRHVLSDWDLDHQAEPRAEVLEWHPGEFRRTAAI